MPTPASWYARAASILKEERSYSMTRRYLITTAITAYQSYQVEADDEQEARDQVYEALQRGNPDVLDTYGDMGFNDDEQIIDSKKLVAP